MSACPRQEPDSHDLRDGTTAHTHTHTHTHTQACGTAAGITTISQIDREILRPERARAPAPRRNLPEAEMWAPDLEREGKPGKADLALEHVHLPGACPGFAALFQVYRAIQCGDHADWRAYGWMWPEEGVC